ncbi:hypothetical protein CO166_03640 [Candidatus Roizmanbacteria bacterium CG_4_9_14_3_um_filter_36_11]|nr:MAG: hypothetical protein CO166_03640 [Candidatus Roizmanbacteria bacterium CG_4_9_14_3_um_filter_36_11]
MEKSERNPKEGWVYMILPKREDVFHKVQLYRLLTGLIDSNLLSRSIYFKGGTAASMMGFLDRFSVDLDFDLKKDVSIKKINKERTGKTARLYLEELIDFITKKVTERMITEGLSFLLPADSFNKVRKILKKETLMLLQDEIIKLQKN